MILVTFNAWCAAMNRARGSSLYGLTTSTTISRLASMLGIALAVYLLAVFSGHSTFTSTALLLWTWAALMLWCIPAWDSLWGMAIGTTTPLRASFAPVDWIMSVLWPKTPTAGTFRARLWGLIAMSLRQTLAAPWVIGLACLAGHPEKAWLAIFTPLLGVFYFAFGFVSQTYAVMLAELAVGASLGLFAINLC
jgi:hypothetical protein